MFNDIDTGYYEKMSRIVKTRNNLMFLIYLCFLLFPFLFLRPSILELIQPLVDAGTLVVRPRVQIEKEIETYYVYTRDDFVVACGQLKLFIDDGGYAEIACLAVRNDYRKLGKVRRW